MADSIETQAVPDETSAENQLEQLPAVQNRHQQEVGALGEAEMTRQAKHNKKWNRRLKIFFCCLGYKKNKVRIIQSTFCVCS